MCNGTSWFEVNNYQANRPFVLTCVISTNDPLVYILGPAVTDLTVTNIRGFLGADSSVYDFYVGAVNSYTGFAYGGTDGSTAVNIPVSAGALMYLWNTNGSPTNTGITLRGNY